MHEFKVIEQLCASKTANPQDCEDILVVNSDYIAVIDGATSLNARKYQGKTGGKIAAELIAQCLQTGWLNSQFDCETAIGRIQAELQAYSKAHQLQESCIHLCASAVIYHVAKRQIWTVGDCQFILNGKHYTFTKKVDTILAETRSLAVHMLLQSGYTEQDLLRKDVARDLILDALKLQKSLENSDDEFGYGVFSSQGHVKNPSVINVPPGSEVILASDGYPELFSTLKESEDRLNELIRTDPLCYRYNKATKGLMEGNTHFDDRTYIRFQIR